MRPAKSSSVDPGALSDVALVVGQGRAAADVAGEFTDVLADEHDIVVCDLRGMAAPSSAVEVLAPATDYLRHWNGTTVVVCVPDPVARESVLAAVAADCILLAQSIETGLEAALARRRRLRRMAEQLAPMPTAPRDARRMVARTLLDWRLPRMVPPTTLVVSELVTNSVVHAMSLVELTLTQSDELLRVAVRDHGGGRQAPRGADAAQSLLRGRGLLIVQALTRCWGVFPGRTSGKTVWAVLDAAAPRERQVSA